MRRKRSNIRGHVDHAGGGLVRGWATDLRATRSRLALDVFRYGVYLGCARAGALRRDLREQGIGDGYYGFVFQSPALAAPDASDGLEVVAPDAKRTRLTIPGKGRPPIDPEPAPRHALTDARSFLGPLLEAISRDADVSPAPCFAATPEMNARIDRLFATTPESSVSAFAAHIAAKYEVPVTPSFLRNWYLETYGLEQAMRTPLSAKDIDELAEARLANRDDDGGSLWPAGRGRRLYHWVVHESRRLEVEDCLVDSEAIETLRAVPWLVRFSDFPLSRFMRLLRRRHPLLRGCPVETASDRTAFYAVLMLLALRDVHYLGLMPPLWLDRMLAERTGGSAFERAQQILFGRHPPLLSRDAYCARIGSMGFDLSAKRFSTLLDKGHRLALRTPLVRGSVVDVQMIGPFRQSLGLAESCRRIAGALQATGLNLNFVDYRIGGRPQEETPAIDTGAFRDARINILHLNADEVPEAMVSLPGLLGGTHTIVIPYWELDRPSRAHRLGLDLVDEVWCATRFLENVFAGPKPVRYIGMSFDDRHIPPPRTALIAEGRRPAFTVICVADALSWLQRKNVFGAVEAFQRAFAGDAAARLIVKMRNVDAACPATHGDAWRRIVARCGSDPRIDLLDADFETGELKALLAGADCLLSLHRAEGVGLDMLDAMWFGTPVVATAYSGNMDFCNAETAWLVDYDLVPVAPGEYAFVEAGHVWAEPRLESAVAALRAVRDDAATRGEKTKAARAHVQAEASPARLAARLARLLRARLSAGDMADEAAE